jgi:hypothetical protein
MTSLSQPWSDAGHAESPVSDNAFLAEHRGCWRLHGEGLQSGADGAAIEAL